MITSNIIYRVFQLMHGDGTGTAFSIDHGDREHLVTAAHVVSGLKSGDNIRIMRDGVWVAHNVEWIAFGADKEDVAIFRIAEPLTPKDLPAEASDAGLAYGQDVFFLGFPYGWVGHHKVHSGFPLAFVKSATMSQFDPKLIYLDGHNNPGFSGGPVVFLPPGEHQWKIAGIISGYHAMPEKIHKGTDETEYSANMNTGIIVACRVQRALNLLA